MVYTDEPTRPLTPKEKKTLAVQEAEQRAKDERLALRRKLEREQKEIARKGALVAAKRSVVEARNDKRWAVVQDTLRSEAAAAHSSGVGTPITGAPPSSPGGRPRTPSARPRSPRSARQSPSHRRMARLPHETLAVASKCIILGDGVNYAVTRQTSRFIIEAFDGAGERRPTGGDAFHVAIRGASPATVKVQDMKDGTYHCYYRLSISGNYSVSVTLHGAPVAQSPYNLTVPALATQPLATYSSMHSLHSLRTRGPIRRRACIL